MAAVLNTLRRIPARAQPAPGGRVESRRANALGTGAVLTRRVSFGRAGRFAFNHQHCRGVVMGMRGPGVRTRRRSRASSSAISASHGGRGWPSCWSAAASPESILSSVAGIGRRCGRFSTAGTTLRITMS